MFAGKKSHYTTFFKNIKWINDNMSSLEKDYMDMHVLVIDCKVVDSDAYPTRLIKRNGEKSRRPGSVVQYIGNYTLSLGSVVA